MLCFNEFIAKIRTIRGLPGGAQTRIFPSYPIRKLIELLICPIPTGHIIPLYATTYLSQFKRSPLCFPFRFVALRGGEQKVNRYCCTYVIHPPGFVVVVRLCYMARSLLVLSLLCDVEPNDTWCVVFSLYIGPA